MYEVVLQRDTKLQNVQVQNVQGSLADFLVISEIQSPRCTR